MGDSAALAAGQHPRKTGRDNVCGLQGVTRGCGLRGGGWRVTQRMGGAERQKGALGATGGFQVGTEMLRG